MPPSQPTPVGNPENTFYEGDEPRVLVNKLDVRDAAEMRRHEKLALDRAYKTVLASQAPDSRQFQITAATFKTLHATIFGQLYEWAGRWRTVNIVKDGMKWPNAAFLEQSMQSFERDVLQTVTPRQLQSDPEFCRAAAKIHGEFIAVHPFREGNGRTARLACDLLAINTGRPILHYDRSPEGVERYIHANKLVVYRADYGLLEEVFSEALKQAQSQRTVAEPAQCSNTPHVSSGQGEVAKAAIGTALASDLGALDAALAQVKKVDLEPER
jgi:cell filamentation protein